MAAAGISDSNASTFMEGLSQDWQGNSQPVRYAPARADHMPQDGEHAGGDDDEPQQVSER